MSAPDNLMLNLKMKIALLIPFYSGSHKQWADGLIKHSAHQIELFSLPGRFWKWRMHGGAITLAKAFLESSITYDLIVTTDMLDVTTFLSLIRTQKPVIPIALYFHENQLTYPWSPEDVDPELGRDQNYAFINYSSALVADQIFFNSPYHQESFLGALPRFLNQFPDHKNLSTIEEISKKSSVLPLGLEFPKVRDQHIIKRDKAVLLWNHRWEFDKNPEAFFQPLFQLADEGLPFELIVLGTQNTKYPTIFDDAKDRLKDQLIHFGTVKDKEEYFNLLTQADIAPTTSNQDFFGISVVEAIHANCHPLLPKRLAYPMHIPESEYRHVFYHSSVELKRKIVECIYKIEVIRGTNYRSWVEHYDWNNMIQVYDAQLAKCLN